MLEQTNPKLDQQPADTTGVNTLLLRFYKNNTKQKCDGFSFYNLETQQMDLNTIFLDVIWNNKYIDQHK